MQDAAASLYVPPINTRDVMTHLTQSQNNNVLHQSNLHFKNKLDDMRRVLSWSVLNDIWQYYWSQN